MQAANRQQTRGRSIFQIWWKVVRTASAARLLGVCRLDAAVRIASAARLPDVCPLAAASAGCLSAGRCFCRVVAREPLLLAGVCPLAAASAGWLPVSRCFWRVSVRWPLLLPGVCPLAVASAGCLPVGRCFCWVSAAGLPSVCPCFCWVSAGCLPVGPCFCWVSAGCLPLVFFFIAWASKNALTGDRKFRKNAKTRQMPAVLRLRLYLFGQPLGRQNPACSGAEKNARHTRTTRPKSSWSSHYQPQTFEITASNGILPRSPAKLI